MAQKPVTAQAQVLALVLRTIERNRAYNAEHPHTGDDGTLTNVFHLGPRLGLPYACIYGERKSKLDNAYTPKIAGRRADGVEGKATWPEIFAAEFPKGVIGLDGKAHTDPWAPLIRLVGDGELVCAKDGSKYFLPKDRPDLDATADGPVSVKAAPKDKAEELKAFAA